MNNDAQVDVDIQPLNQQLDDNDDNDDNDDAEDICGIFLKILEKIRRINVFSWFIYD